MLNPSVAASEKNDPTVLRNIGFAKRWNFGALDVANIFGLVSTDPKALYSHQDPIGPDNDSHILDVADKAKLIVCAWGNHGKLHS